MLPKKFRLPAKDFNRVYSSGLKYRGKFGMLVVVKNDNKSPRVGFVVSKKIGNAVIRHRMTRLLRVIFLEIFEEFNNPPFDIQYISFEFCNEKEILKKDIHILFEKLVNA